MKIFEKIGCLIEENNIETCHRISKKNERIIVKFSHWKDCQNVLNAKKELIKVDMKEICFLEDNLIFMNKSLWIYYCVLWSKANCLHSSKRVNSFYVSGGTVKIKIIENSLLLPITRDWLQRKFCWCEFSTTFSIFIRSMIIIILCLFFD